MLDTEQDWGYQQWKLFVRLVFTRPFLPKGFLLLLFPLLCGGVFFLLRIVALSSVYIDRLVTIVKIISRRELSVLI